MFFKRALFWKSTLPLILVLIVIASVLGFEVYAFIVVHTKGNVSLPPTLGNFERVRALLKDDQPGDTFSFALAGDTKGCGTFERICAQLKDEPLAFMVLLGDCVREGTPGYHRYFRAEWAEELAMPFPVFYVVGNHDVDPETFSLSTFEETYGPTNFSFEYKDCLFIVLRILGKPYGTEESYAFLESVLSRQRSQYRKVFVFMHMAPPVAPDIVVKDWENPEKLFELADRYNIDYVITGDYHGYSRVERKNTVYLITAGGGSHISDRKFGNFHHAIIIEVSENSINEKLLYIPRQEDLEDHLERYVFSDFSPWASKNVAIVILLNIALVAGVVFLLTRIIKTFRISRDIVSDQDKS